MRAILIGALFALFSAALVAQEYPPHVGKSYPSTDEARRKTIPPQWMKVSELYLNVAVPRQTIGPVFVNSYTLVGPQETGTWHSVDLGLSPWSVPKDAKLALLSGILIITHGIKAEPANLAVYLRAPGDEQVECDTPFIVGQATVDTAGNEQLAFAGSARQNIMTWVPLKDGQFEFCWTRSSRGQFPEHSSYGINLGVHGWAR